VVGDDIRISRTIGGLNQEIVRAWLTIKVSYELPDFLIQKIITIAPTSNGQITDTGVSGVASVYFDLSNLDTKLFSAYKLYYFDIQVSTTGGKIYTPEEGTISTLPEITVTT
jgi:hypothetical protein